MNALRATMHTERAVSPLQPLHVRLVSATYRASSLMNDVVQLLMIVSNCRTESERAWPHSSHAGLIGNFE